jgi:sortase A
MLTVARRPAPTPEHHHNETSALLHTLLETPVSEEDRPLRPVALRSTDEQRRQALSDVLCRTWVDRLLYGLERLLLLAMLAVFAHWFIDGYGRDWLHAWQHSDHPPAQSIAYAQAGNLPVLPVLTDTVAISRTAASLGTAPLPFVPASMAEASARRAPPDYLAPRALPVPRQHIDPRPARLLIPAIELDTAVEEVFIEDGAWQVAEYAAGYHHGTALPGETGNTVMAGHAGLRGAVFRSLGALQAGDDIFVDAGNWRHQYQVRQLLSVWPTRVEVMQPTSTPVLTLITCTAWDTQRLVVIADLIDSHPL